MKTRDAVVVVVLFLLFASKAPEDAPEPPDKPVGLFPDIVVTLPAWQHEVVTGVLTDGLVEGDGWSLDLSRVQTMTVSDGVLHLDPPARVRRGGLVKLGTTVSEIRAEPDRGRILIDLDLSPVDIDVRPEGVR